MNKEQLSVLMDDEASSFEVRRSVQLLGDSKLARDQLDQYQLIRAVLRDQLPPMDVRGFADKVRARIDTENIESIEKLAIRPGKAVAAYAIAATVTAAAVFGIWQSQTGISPGTAPPVLASGMEGLPAQSEQQALVKLESEPSRVASNVNSARMSSYLVNHSESSPPAVIPFASLVGYNN